MFTIGKGDWKERGVEKSEQRKDLWNETPV